MARAAAWLLIFCPAWSTVTSGVAAAQPPGPRPSSFSDDGVRPEAAKRLVRVFDFEESEVNPNPVPRFWFRAQDNPPERERAGFPPWNAAGFDYAMAHSGKASVRVPAEGGSGSLRLMPGSIPVFAGADYTVSAFIRTKGVRASRAFLVARFLDQRLRPVPGAEFRSPGVRSENEFVEVSLTAPGVWDAAAFLQIDLEVLQPDRFEPKTLPDEFHVREQDVRASAWFDDVVVSQVPRVMLTTASEANICLFPSRPSVHAVVKDLTGEDLTAHLTVTDVDGAVVAVHASGVRGGTVDDWQPDLPAFGYYETRMDVLSGDRVIASSSLRFVWLDGARDSQDGWAGAVDDDAGAIGGVVNVGNSGSRRDAHSGGGLAGNEHGRNAGGVRGLEFGVHLTDSSPGAIEALPAVLRALGLRRVSVPIWDAGLRTETSGDTLRRTGEMLEGLLDAGVDVSVSLPRVPDEAAQRLRIDSLDPLSVFTMPASAWQEYIEPLTNQYGQRITTFHVGSNEIDAPVSEADPAAVRAMLVALERYVPGPAAVIRTRADHALPLAALAAATASSPISLDVLAPASFPARAIGDVVSTIDRAVEPDVDRTVTIELPDESSFGGRAAAAELITRTAELMAAQLETALDPDESELATMSGDTGIDTGGGARGRATAAVMQPWTVRGTSPVLIEPSPALAALHTLTDQVRGRRAIGRLDVADNVTAIILADEVERGSPPGAGALIVWSDDPGSPRSVLRTYLGDREVRVTDAFGNTSVLAPEAGSRPVHSLAIGSTPVFVEGIDAALLRFVSAFRVEPDRAAAIVDQHEHELVLENPWPVRLTGQVQVVGVADVGSESTARIMPTGALSFSIPPHSVERIPFSFVFGPAEGAGTKRVTAALRVTADKQYPAFRVHADIDLGLPDLEMAPFVTLGPQFDGPDVVVHVDLTNTGQQVRTLKLEVAAAGRSTQQAPISALEPGVTLTRKFVFRNAANELSGKRVRVSVIDPEAAQRLNKFVRVP